MEYNMVRWHQLVHGEELIKTMKIGEQFIFELHCAGGWDRSHGCDFGCAHKITEVGKKPMFVAVGRQVSPETAKSNNQMDCTECTPPISRNFPMLSISNLCRCRATSRRKYCLPHITPDFYERLAAKDAGLFPLWKGLFCLWKTV